MERQALILLRGKLARDLHETAYSLELWTTETEKCGSDWSPRREIVAAVLTLSKAEMIPTDDELDETCRDRMQLNDEPESRDP